MVGTIKRASGLPRTEVLAEAYFDLESELRNVNYAAKIATALLNSLGPSVSNGTREYVLSEDDMEMLLFAQLEIERRAKELLVIWDEGLEQAKSRAIAA